MATHPFLTTQDVAQRFHVSPSTVARWARDGIIRASRMPGKRSRLRFELADVDDFAVRFNLDEQVPA